MAALHSFVAATFWEPEPENQATAYLHLLAMRYHAFVRRIDLDQWGGMSIESSRSEKLEGDPVDLSVQFDRFEDGLALAIQTLHETYGPERRWHEDE